MDKNVIKKYAVWARRELISRVSQRAALYGITVDGYVDQNATNVGDRILSVEEKKQRSALISQIKIKGYEQAMEEIAYTWFNRFSALRFMEVNGYLPTRIRVFTDDENNFKPQILTEAINMEMDGLDMQKVYDLKNANDNDTLFKYMIITQCNALSSILPGMFQRISDHTELLFPDNLLREGSVVEQMITMIPQSDWTDQVQIIGWLYEGYNTERNELVYDGNMSKSRITKDLLPAATTIFTPDWPIRYMVENSLGRLWLEGHPNDNLKAEWKYYLDEAGQEPEVRAQLAEIRKEYAALKPEDILAIDPCQGSGHILAYMFDVLVQIYEAYGYSAREAASSIVENNIWGLDIDERAAQLAYFSLMMKARQYDRRFFSRSIQPHVYAIQESNNLDSHCIEYYVDGRKELKSAMDILVKELHDAKEYGSILNVTQVNFSALYARFDEIQNEVAPSIYSYQAVDTLLPFVKVAQVLAQRYHIVVTNPPYLGNSRFSPKLDQFIKKFYSDVKSDLSMVMYKRAIDSLVYKNGFVAFITTSSWMVLSSFEKLRNYVNSTVAFSSLVDFGTELFEGKVGHNLITAWVIRKHRFNYNLTAIRLVDFCYSRRDEKEPEFFNSHNRYFIKQANFDKIPGTIIAYWISDKFASIFDYTRIEKYALKICKGGYTGNNDKYLRLWYEIDHTKVPKKWNYYSKGGSFRRWYGNSQHVILWENDGHELKTNPKSGVGASQYYGKEHFVWSGISIGLPSFRYDPAYVYFDDVSPAVVFAKEVNYPLLALLNSCITVKILRIIAPTMHFQAGDIRTIPVAPEVFNLNTQGVLRNIQIAKEDWDSNETSWDFQKHPLIFFSGDSQKISQCFALWKEDCEKRFIEMKNNEEAINEVLIGIYGLNDEMSPEIDDKDVSVSRVDIQRDIRSFISYAIGCMFGRYSLDTPGLAYAGGLWDASLFKKYKPDNDGIIPICDDEYFEDDIVGRFVNFIEVVYGKDTLEENLRFIADALGGKGSSREVIRNYFINDFYADHLKVYQKRPIYWLFDSGKKNGFKCLIYMHRYLPDTIARIRTDYVHEQQSRYRTSIANLESRIDNVETGERVKLVKRLGRIRAQAEELRVYEEKIHHLADQMIKIDLDDGVKANYAKFQDVLAKIK